MQLLHTHIVLSIWLQPLALIYILCTLLQEGCCLQAFQQGLSAPAPQHIGTTLALAHFLDHMYHHRPAKRVEASPWYEAANSLVQDLLSQTVKDAPKVKPRELHECMNCHIATASPLCKASLYDPHAILTLFAL